MELRNIRGGRTELLSRQSRFREAAALWTARIVERREDSTAATYSHWLDSLVLPELGELQLQERDVAQLDAFFTRHRATLQPGLDIKTITVDELNQTARSTLGLASDLIEPSPAASRVISRCSPCVSPLANCLKGGVFGDAKAGARSGRGHSHCRGGCCLGDDS